MNILLLTAHDIAEFDDLRMLADLGANVFSIGAYTDPTQGSAMRPPLDVPSYPELAQRCVEQRDKHAGDPMQFAFAGQIHNVVDWAKADLHPDIIDWADTIICHHYLESWIARQWDRIKHKRVIWRTCGQSNPMLEQVMRVLHEQGLEIIRYSPKEEIAFTRLGVFAGQDTLIRFGKYPEDYGPWIPTGTIRFPDGTNGPYIANVTQNMVERGEFCGLSFYLAATEGLPAAPAGPNSEKLPNGLGSIGYDFMLNEYLPKARAYLYTGTQPASYTLGLIEAMMTGVPVVSIGPGRMWEPGLFEGHEIADNWDWDESWAADDPAMARSVLQRCLNVPEVASDLGNQQRERAIDLFGIENVAPQWAAFLGLPVRELAAA